MEQHMRGRVRIFLGQTSLWTAAFLCLAAWGGLPARGALLLNEIYVNPPGTDGSNEYVEVLSTTGGDSLDDIWLLEIEGDGAGAGVVDGARNLTGLALGSNGLLVLGEGYSAANPWGITNPPTGLADLARGAVTTLENGTISFLLVSGFTGAVTNDLDTNDDGTLDTTPWSSILDSIGWSDGGATDRNYAPMLTTAAGTADAASRIFGDTTASSAAAWWGGDILDTDPATTNDLSTAYDLATVGNGANRSAGSITPGVANVPEPTSAVLGLAGVALLLLVRRRWA